MLSSSLVSSGTGTADDLLRLEIIKACSCAYWENDRFKNSLIDAPERLQAVFDVILGYSRMFGTEEVLERLKEPPRHTETQAPQTDSTGSTPHP